MDQHQRPTHPRVVVMNLSIGPVGVASLHGATPYDPLGNRPQQPGRLTLQVPARTRSISAGVAQAPRESAPMAAIGENIAAASTRPAAGVIQEFM
jgi:hypothetical protein